MVLKSLMLDRENEREEQIRVTRILRSFGNAFATASRDKTALASKGVRDDRLQEGYRPVVVESISIRYTDSSNELCLS